MRYVVGYTQDGRGQDALNLATSLALTQGAEVDLVTVVDRLGSGAQRENVLERALDQAANDARGSGVGVTTLVKLADSFAEGLIEVAEERKAGLIVVGATKNEMLRRFTVGSVANALLHASPVPVGLATRGYLHRSEMTRISVGVGTRAGSDALIDVAVETAARRGLPLRFISLVGLDADSYDAGAYKQAARHIEMVRDWAVKNLPEDHVVETEVVRGDSVEDAIDQLDWESGEFLVLGSSRLAQGRRIFMGGTANKILRALPVPMVVVPRDYEAVEPKDRV